MAIGGDNVGLTHTLPAGLRERNSEPSLSKRRHDYKLETHRPDDGPAFIGGQVTRQA
jgi:hypothetical protein